MCKNSNTRAATRVLSATDPILDLKPLSEQGPRTWSRLLGKSNDLDPSRESDDEEDYTPESLSRALAEIADVWDDVQLTRNRDAVYLYLTSVFGFVRRWSWRGTINKRFRKACRKHGITVPKDAEMFSFVIRRTSDPTIVDGKTCSKWSRALRYAARFKGRGSFTGFVQRNGGLNGCARMYALRLGRGRK